MGYKKKYVMSKFKMEGGKKNNDWKRDRKENKYGYYGGLDMIQLRNDEAIKRHPEPAPVLVLAGKYINVPDHLLGPIKYASETINIEQLFVPTKSNEKF